MSTRATYSFISDNLPAVTFYIHCDGYKEGAAQYFYNAVVSENESGSFVSKFLRANERADFTRSHDAHGDTEYRYTLSDSFLLTVEAYNHTSDDWGVDFTGPLDQFINDYSGAYVENPQKVFMLNGRLTVESFVLRYVHSSLTSAANMLARGLTGNAHSSLGHALDLLEAIKLDCKKAGFLITALEPVKVDADEEARKIGSEFLEKVASLI